MTQSGIGVHSCSLQAGVIEEVVSEALDDALDSEDIEEETEEEIDKVLTAIAGETAAQLPEAIRKEKLKQPAAHTVEDEEVCLKPVMELYLFAPFFAPYTLPLI